MDPDSRHEYLEQNTKTKLGNDLSDGSDVLQPVWVRCSSILAISKDGKFMESQLRFVLYSGIILWFIYLITT